MSTAYEVLIASSAQRQLRRLPNRVAVAVVEFITGVLPEKPQRLSKPLGGDFQGLHSARRGDYRLLLEIDEEARTVLVVRVAHRAEAYRPPPPDA